MGNLSVAFACSNRTIVGLKPEVSEMLTVQKASGSNRTIVGLKLTDCRAEEALWRGSNRTIVGLKLTAH